MSQREQSWKSIAADAVVALARIADAADRGVFVAEAWSERLGAVRPEDVGMEAPEETT
jgi:hypothetical protein